MGAPNNVSLWPGTQTEAQRAPSELPWFQLCSPASLSAVAAGGGG